MHGAGVRRPLSLSLRDLERLPARHELLARATDRTGLTQPDTVPCNEGGYQFWAVARHPVMAGARSRSG